MCYKATRHGSPAILKVDQMPGSFLRVLQHSHDSSACLSPYLRTTTIFVYIFAFTSRPHMLTTASVFHGLRKLISTSARNSTTRNQLTTKSPLLERTSKFVRSDTVCFVDPPPMFRISQLNPFLHRAYISKWKTEMMKARLHGHVTSVFVEAKFVLPLGISACVQERCFISKST